MVKCKYSAKQITVEAPAKINWFLAVKNRRTDGYHELETCMQKLSLADTIHLVKAAKEGVSLRCMGADLPEDNRNLAYQAGMVFLAKIREKCGVDIVLKKKIPIAAGLGGGSSDAAAVLHGLNTLFAEVLDDDQLLALARSLGADVPFFMTSYNTAIASGIGDILSEVSVAFTGFLVLVNPGFSVSTKWVYENFILTAGGNPYTLDRESAYDNQPCFDLNNKNSLFNDLESVTIKRFPEIAVIKERLLADGAAAALMSGSGPTVFGLFAEKEVAVASLENFRPLYGSNLFLTTPYPEHRN